MCSVTVQHYHNCASNIYHLCYITKKSEKSSNNWNRCGKVSNILHMIVLYSVHNQYVDNIWYCSDANLNEQLTNLHVTSLLSNTGTFLL